MTTKEDPAIVLEDLNASIRASHDAQLAADRAAKLAEELKDVANNAETLVRTAQIRYRAAVLGLSWEC